MDKRKSEIHEHQSAIDELDVTIERQTAELGRLILQNDECPQEFLKEPFGVGKEIQSEIAAKENRREDIRSALERLRQLDEQLEELDEEDKSFEKSRSEMVASLGAHAFRVYRTGSLKNEGFDEIFDEINSIDSQLSERERTVQSLSLAQDEKNVFQKLPGGAKITLLKSGIVRLEKKRDTALSNVGERLLETEKVEEIPDEQVRSATSNIKQQEERREERRRQKEALAQEKEELNQKIEAQSSSSSPEKALKQLDNEIKQQQERLYTQQLQVGKVYLLQSASDDSQDAEQQMVLNRIHELEQQKQQHQDKVNTLQSELEIEELQDDMKKKEEHISRLEKKISEEKQEVEQIRDDLSADNNRIKELRRMVQSEDNSSPSGSSGTGKPKKAAPKKQKSTASSTAAKKAKEEQELDLEPNSSEQVSDEQEVQVQDKQDTQGETPDEKK